MIVYRWNDEVIPDIRVWARTRGEKMVEYERYREHPNPLTGEIVREAEHDEMPMSFWNNLRSGEGWVYHVIRSYAP